MKILFITEKFPPIVCSGNRVYNLVKGLSKIHDITVMSRENNRWLFPMPVDTTIPKLDGVSEIGFKINDSLLLIPTMVLFKLKLISNSKFYFDQIKKKIDEDPDKFKNFELVIVSGPSWDSFKGAEYLFDKFNIPFILDYRDPWVSRNKTELDIQKRIINKAKAVVTVTDSFAKQIKKLTDYKKDISIIENGVDLNSVKDLKQEKPKDNKLRIGFAGNFVNYQNVDILLRAISQLPNEIKENVIFEGCGGPFQKKYEKLSKKLNVVSNYYGHLSINEMNKVLINCDLFYIGYFINDAVGGKFYNYLALNKPILGYTFKNSQLDKEINSNKLGFLCFSELELAKKIEEIYNNRKLLSEDNFNIKKYIKNYDWSKIAEKYKLLM
jgi:glycosyltransferase involved in cell wall biosynthesis